MTTCEKLEVAERVLQAIMGVGTVAVDDVRLALEQVQSYVEQPVIPALPALPAPRSQGALPGPFVELDQTLLDRVDSVISAWTIIGTDLDDGDGWEELETTMKALEEAYTPYLPPATLETGAMCPRCGRGPFLLGFIHHCAPAPPEHANPKMRPGGV